MTKRFPIRVLALTTLLLMSGATNADWREAPVGRLQAAAADAASMLRKKVPATRRYFDEAWGYVVFPGITRAAIGFGAAHGKGIVVDSGTVIGHASYWQFSSGIQAGAKYFSMIVFFKDREDLEAFTAGRAELMGQAGITAASLSADATPAYDDGVAVFAQSRFGLMAEISISGARFNYKPVPDQKGRKQ